jgi:hypothetical protein
MKLPRRNFLHLTAGATALPAVSQIAKAQSYPTRPIAWTRAPRFRASKVSATPPKLGA